jgi:hypothetical protein
LKRKILVLIVIAFCFTLSLFSKNAYWKPNISITPAAPRAGQTVHFKAILNLEGDIASCQSNYMQNLRFVVKVDEEVIYNEILYYFCPATDYPIKANWTAKGGSHKVVFTVEATDSTTPDSNPNDNMVQKTFSVYQAPPITGGPPQIPPGNPALPGLPPNVHTSAPKLNVKFKPCVQYQAEPTDLMVHSLMVYPSTGNDWEFKATVQNLGRRCLKVVEYKLKNMTLTLISSHVGNYGDSAGFYFGEGQSKTIKAKFAKPPSGFFYYPSEGHNFADFEFVIDPNQMIPDPDRSNNSKTAHVMLN